MIITSKSKFDRFERIEGCEIQCEAVDRDVVYLKTRGGKKQLLLELTAYEWKALVKQVGEKEK